jgi:hypothetical protein
MRRTVRRLQVEILALFLAILARDPTAVLADPDICGNGIDDDGDGLLDECCNPERYLHVREAPLARRDVGIAAPITGQQAWTEPADFDIDVAYGPDLQFVRSYDSLVNQTGALKAPMNQGWRHNYMSWLEFNPSLIINARLPSGAEVRFFFDAFTASYIPQTGHRVGRITVVNDEWTLPMHDGSKYIYRGAGGNTKYLYQIVDPRGYALTMTHTSGRLTKVTAATGAKELRFSYSGSPLQLDHVEYWADGVKRADLELVYATLFWPGRLLSAKLGGATFRNYTVDAYGHLSMVADGSGHTIAEFKYAAGSPGKVVRALSGEGVVGYKYGDSTCNGGAGVYQYFNLKDDGTEGEGVWCDTNAQCGDGYYCGGQTDPGSGTTGRCFRARRCVTMAGGNEDLVDSVSSSCPTCTDVADRAWDTNSFRLLGEKDAENVWTSYLYDSNGYVTTMVEKDDNEFADEISPHPPNPANARTTWFFYGNSNFPGLVTEVRRKSELKPTGTCTNAIATDCKRTLTTYTTGGQVDTIQETGFTYNLAGSVISYSYTTDYDYDAQGRITRVDGPRTGTSYDIIQYTYWSGAGNLQDNYLNEVKRQRNATQFVTTTHDGYDYWGNVRLL